MISTEIQQVKQRFGIIGNAPALLQAVERAVQIAPIDDVDVLVTGESGVGKEFFPQIIHAYSVRKHGKYIAVNCGAIPEGTIDSELFGHEKGAFTGAVAARKGYFEEADGGTIFLDEVGELPLTTQARLLRVLESGEFLRVGSSAVLKTNVRVVAATNLDMVKAISEGRFREDLFYRLNTVHIEVPPLRDRADDIPLLFRKFATDFAERYRMPAIQLTDDARRVLMSYRWPGNVRQLRNVARQISIYETSREITGDILKGYLPQYTVGFLPTLHQGSGSDEGAFREDCHTEDPPVQIQQEEQQLICAAISRRFMSAPSRYSPKLSEVSMHSPSVPKRDSSASFSVSSILSIASFCMIRWHGMITRTGFMATACATALVPDGQPQYSANPV